MKINNGSSTPRTKNNYEPTRRKGAQAKRDATSLSVGKDIGLNEISEYLSLALVGQFCKKSVGEAVLGRWMDDKWKPYQKKILLFHIIFLGWIVFGVEMEEDIHKLMDNSLNSGPSALYLKGGRMISKRAENRRMINKFWPS